jgi:hypothetical protein
VPEWIEKYEGDRSGTEHTTEDTLDLDDGRALERAYAAAARVGKWVSSRRGVEQLSVFVVRVAA